LLVFKVALRARGVFLPVLWFFLIPPLPPVYFVGCSQFLLSFLRFHFRRRTTFPFFCWPALVLVFARNGATLRALPLFPLDVFLLFFLGSIFFCCWFWGEEFFFSLFSLPIHQQTLSFSSLALPPPTNFAYPPHPRGSHSFGVVLLLGGAFLLY